MDPDLQDALIAWQGGELPTDRADALLEKLRSEAAFRQQFVTQVWTLSLTQVAQAPDPRWLALHEELGLSMPAPSVAQDSFEESLMKTVRREPLRFVNAWWRRAATLAAAAVVVLAAMLLTRQEVESRKDRAAETLAVWVPASTAGTSQALFPGPLKLRQEKARLLFTNGVVLDVEGPAELDLVSASRVVCREGRLRTHVPKGAEGFCVETPQGSVTDLGTVLGISVVRSGRTDVNVFEGQAELSTSIPGQQGTRTAVLNESEKASLGSRAGTGVIGLSEETQFLPSLQPPPPPLRLPRDYTQRVLAAKPALYWKLDRVTGEQVPSEIPGQQALTVVGGVSSQPTAQGGAACMRFSGSSAPGVLHLAEAWATPAEGYAVEFWFMSEALGQMAMAALTTPDAKRPHLALVELGGRGSTGAGLLRYLLRWPPGQRDGMNLYSTPLAALPYQWHHVVSQQKGDRMELFLNGRSIGTAVIDSAVPSVPVLLQFGALELRPGQLPSSLRRPFQGCLAEVAVYPRLLSPEEVRAHAGH